MILNNLPMLHGLSSSDSDILLRLSDELHDSLDKRQIFRTETEMRISVLNDNTFPTKASKYWQCVREQAVMIHQAALESLQYRKNELAIRKTTFLLSQSKDEFDCEEMQISLDEYALTKHSLEKVISDRVREIKLWSLLKSELDDGSFDTQNVNSHQLISYISEFIQTITVSDKSLFSGEEYRTLTGKLKTCIRRGAELGVLNQLPPELHFYLQDKS